MPAAKKVPEQSQPKNQNVAVVLLTCLTMLAFAANSLLTRIAFQTTSIDAASFTFIRIFAGALALFVIAVAQRKRVRLSVMDGFSAFLLFVYAAAFSFAYRNISTGAGALILFASAQLMMISYGVFKGERASILGILMALGGLLAFLAPGASAPPLEASLLMALSGLAWGGFSLLGKASDSPITGTASSFLLAVPLSLLVLVARRGAVQIDQVGVLYAVLSGSLASGLGYAIWYWVRVRLAAISAGAVQLSVPVLSAALGVLILDEKITLASSVAALVVLGGVALVTLTAKRR